MAGTIDQLNFEVLIKDDQFKEKVNADLALAKELNVQLSTLLDLQSKMPKIKISTEGGSQSAAKDAAEAAIAEERRATAVANRVAAEQRAATATTNAATAEQRRLTSIENRVAAEHRAAKAATDAAAAEERKAAAVANKTAAEQRAIKATTDAAAAEERKGAAAASRVAAEQRATAATSNAAAAATRAATALVNKAAAESRASKAATDAAAAEERKAGAAANRAAAEARAEKAVAQAAKAQLQLNDAMLRSNKAALRQSRLLGELKNMALMYFSVRGAWQFVRSLVRITGEFELQRTALGSMIGDLNQAKQLVAEIQELAIKSPFAFKELTSYTKQLAAFSVPTEELYETTKMLADVSAGLGVGMDRIILAYGQIRSAAFLRGQEVRQLTEAGIPILKELAKQFEEVEGRAVSAGEVFDKISARLVPFEMVEKVFKDMTSEGGKFYEMQEIQAETLRGKVMNLKDAFEMMMNEIGTDNQGRLKGAVDNLRGMMLNWEKWGTILKSLIVTLGLYKATVLAVVAAERVLLLNNRINRWQHLHSLLKTTTKETNRLAVSMRALGVTKKMMLGGIVAGVAALATMTISAINNATKLKKELKEIGGSASEGVEKTTSDLSRLIENLGEATEGTQEYRDVISELNRKYADYLPNQLKEADGYDAIAAAAQRAEQAIRNKAKADAETEGLAAIEKEFRDKLTGRADILYSSLMGLGGGISKKMARDIKASFDTALLEEGAADAIYETFARVADSYLGGEGKFAELIKELGKNNAQAAEVYYEAIESYAKMRIKVNEKMDDFRRDLDENFGTRYSTKEERLGVEKIEEEFRKADNALKGVVQSQDEYDKEIRKLNIKKLYDLADLYQSLDRPKLANQYRDQAKALEGLQEGWRGTINAALEGLNLTKNTSFGLWADEYTQSVNYVEELLKRYQEIDKEMLMVESFDSDMVANLEKNKKAIEAVAKALNINIQALLDSKKKGKGKSPEQIELEMQINMVKKLKQSYEDLRDFLDDDQMRRILKSLFPNAKEDWLKNFDFDAVLLKMAEELEKYDTQAASSLRDSVGKDAAKDLSDLFEAFKKYKEAVDDWKAEDFNFYGGDEVGKILRDLSKEYESIEKKRKKTLELLRKAEAGDAEAIALLRTTLGEEVWKKYVTEGKKAIEELANAERDVAYKEAEDKAKEKASEMLKERMEKENIDLTDFADKSIAQVRTLLERLGKLKVDIQTEIANLEEGGLTEDEKIRLAELTEELELVGKQAADTGEELDKKIGDALTKIAKQTSKTFSNLGKDIADFGKALGNDNLIDFGEQLTEMSTLAGSLAGKIHDLSEELKGIKADTAFKDLSEAAKGGIISIMAEAVLYVYKSWKNAILEYIELQDTLIEKQHEYLDLMREISREEFTNIFGTDEMGLAAENARILNEAQEKYNKTLDEFNNKARIYKSGGGYSFKKITAADLLGDISEAQGWDLYLDNGNLNIDAIEMYYETFKKRLTRKQRKLVEELIENGKALDDAAAQQAEYLTDLFSGVADNIADSMVEAFIESGNAAIDMGNIMSDVAKTMVADLIKSMFIKDILDKYQEDLKKIATDETKDLDQKTSASLAVLDAALAEIDSVTPEIQKVLERYLEYLGTGEDADDDKTLGAGIKGITEDTANLLASYLNAIRADVSYARTIWERMDVSMQQIAAALAGFSAPSLMEYQAKIESNTYNTMLATQSILSNLQSVMDYEGGTAAIRVS